MRLGRRGKQATWTELERAAGSEAELGQRKKKRGMRRSSGPGGRRKWRAGPAQQREEGGRQQALGRIGGESNEKYFSKFSFLFSFSKPIQM